MNNLPEGVVDRVSILTDAEYDKFQEIIENFASNIQTDEYVGHRDTTAKKAQHNIVEGKWGEVHMQKILGLPLEDIDFEIRHGASKGWRIDLKEHHVKTCSDFLVTHWKNQGRGCSWTFQWANADNKIGGRDTVFNKPDEKVCLMYLSSNYRSATCKFILRMGQILPLLTTEAIIRSIEGKRYLYESDIKKLFKNRSYNVLDDF